MSDDFGHLTEKQQIAMEFLGFVERKRLAQVRRVCGLVVLRLS